MMPVDARRHREVGDRSGDPEYPVKAARRQGVPVKRLFKKRRRFGADILKGRSGIRLGDGRAAGGKAPCRGNPAGNDGA